MDWARLEDGMGDTVIRNSVRASNATGLPFGIRM